MADKGDPPSTGTVEQKLRIKNKLPAPVQITAEQLLREASERLGGEQGRKRFFLNTGNLDDFLLRERTKFEEALRRSRSNISLYLKYAKFEESQGDLQRARSIYERAVSQDPRSHALWLRYGETEMRAGHLALARNVWDRAVTILPRHDQFWYKRLAMEEAAGEIEMARQVFERWMRWEPDLNAWRSFLKFEMRVNDHMRARIVRERMLLQFLDDPQVWQDYARFEEREASDVEMGLNLKELRVMRARGVFERSLHCILVNSPHGCSHLIEFGKFESRHGEIERARAIYQYALKQFPDSDTLRHSYVSFEKQYGDPSMLGEIVLEKRRKQYEKRVVEQPFDYDGWFDLLRLEEEFFILDNSHIDRVRDAYERAISNVPTIKEKRYWRRYIYLWLFYAIFEEHSASSPHRAIEVLKTCLKVVPHSTFTFAKVWMALVNVFLRLGDVKSARLTFGQAIGKSPKPLLFRAYIDMELELREFDRCRMLFEKFLEFDPGASAVWVRYAELERVLQEEERAKALYELAIAPDSELDIPELVWKAYIDWETECGRFDNARELYERLLERTQHVKVYLSYANMEMMVGDEGCTDRMRNIMKKAYESLSPSPEDRMLLVESWREMELSLGNTEYIVQLEKSFFPVEQTIQESHLEKTVLIWPEPKLDNAQRLLGLAKRWKQSAE